MNPNGPKLPPNGPKMTPGFTHFFRIFFFTEKAVPQTFSLLEFMPECPTLPCLGLFWAVCAMNLPFLLFSAISVTIFPFAFHSFCQDLHLHSRLQVAGDLLPKSLNCSLIFNSISFQRTIIHLKFETFQKFPAGNVG